MQVDDEPGVLAQVAEVLGMQGASIKSVVQKGLGGQARLVMVLHPLLESRFYGAVQLIARMPFVRSEPRAIRVLDEEFELAMGLITRYRERLPFAPGDPVVIARGGLDAARARRARLRARRRRGVAQARGRQPDRLASRTAG